MFPRRSLLRIARLVLGAFLLAQAALAMAACEWGTRDAARAVAMAGGAANAPCHDAAEASADAGLCLTHCLGAQQSLDKPSVALPQFRFDAALPMAPAALVVFRREPPLAAAAPPRILFQSLLI